MLHIVQMHGWVLQVVFQTADAEVACPVADWSIHSPKATNPCSGLEAGWEEGNTHRSVHHLAHKGDFHPDLYTKYISQNRLSIIQYNHREKSNPYSTSRGGWAGEKVETCYPVYLMWLCIRVDSWVSEGPKFESSPSFHVVYPLRLHPVKNYAQAGMKSPVEYSNWVRTFYTFKAIMSWSICYDTGKVKC